MTKRKMVKKRPLQGVQKRKPIKRRRKNLMKKVADYLGWDSYMFAPLISSRSKIFCSSPAILGPEVSEPNKETKNSRLFKKIVEYLKTDSYMYAPLVAAPQSISPPTATLWYMKRVTMEVLTGKVTILDDEPLDMVAKDKTSKSLLHETSISEERTFGHREMENHMVYQNRNVSGKGMLDSQLRKVVVD